MTTTFTKGDRIEVRWPTGINETGTVHAVLNTLPHETPKVDLLLDDGTYCYAAAAWCRGVK